MERENLADLDTGTETHTEKPTALQRIRTGVLGSLARNRRGSEYIQNLAIIGFFVIAVFGAIGLLAGAVTKKLQEQAEAVNGIQAK